MDRGPTTVCPDRNVRRDNSLRFSAQPPAALALARWGFVFERLEVGRLGCRPRLSAEIVGRDCRPRLAAEVGGRDWRPPSWRLRLPAKPGGRDSRRSRAALDPGPVLGQRTPELSEEDSEHRQEEA